jgi:hypothetical protein
VVRIRPAGLPKLNVGISILLSRSTPHSALSSYMYPYIFTAAAAPAGLPRKTGGLVAPVLGCPVGDSNCVDDSRRKGP